MPGKVSVQEVPAVSSGKRPWVRHLLLKLHHTFLSGDTLSIPNPNSSVVKCSD